LAVSETPWRAIRAMESAGPTRNVAYVTGNRHSLGQASVGPRANRQRSGGGGRPRLEGCGRRRRGQRACVPRHEGEAKRPEPSHADGRESSLGGESGHLVTGEPTQHRPAGPLPEQAALRDAAQYRDRDTGQPVSFHIAYNQASRCQRPPRGQDGRGLARREVMPQHRREDEIEAARRERQPTRIALNDRDFAELAARRRRVSDDRGVLVHPDAPDLDAPAPPPPHHFAQHVRAAAAYIEDPQRPGRFAGEGPLE
jgi:hypothetical protein